MLLRVPYLLKHQVQLSSASPLLYEVSEKNMAEVGKHGERVLRILKRRPFEDKEFPKAENKATMFSHWSPSREYVPKLFAKLVPRLENASFGFPSSLDLAPPPPETLHWKYKPLEGEYAKVRALTCYGGMHMWLLTQRLKQFDEKLCKHLWNYYWELVEMWVVNASVPKLGSKGEVTHLQEVVGALCSILTDGLQPLPVDVRDLEPDEMFDGISVRDRLGLIHHLIWLTVYEEKIPISQCVLLYDAVAFLCEQRRALSSMTHDDLCEAEWLWLTQKVKVNVV